MATGSASKWAKLREAADSFFHEKGIESDETFGRSRWHRFAHICLLVAKSFQRNRCPVRAASLAYTTLLALVPLLAVAVSITTGVLQRQGKEPIENLIDNMVEYVAPALDLQTVAPNTEALNELPDEALVDDEAFSAWLAEGGQFVEATAEDMPAAALEDDDAFEAWIAAGGEFVPPLTGRENVVNQITSFIDRINTGTLTVTGSIALLFVAISLLRTIESTFNDIWGVTQGRSIVKSVVYYWAVITLGPIVLVSAIALTTGSQVEKTRELLDRVPMLPTLVAMLFPALLLSIGFAVFYALMPNTRVHWKAALVGGAVGGCLWQLNNFFSVIYLGRVISYTNIYGSLGVFPLFLVGLYFSWLIVLLGAQVAYAFQNRGAYIEERQAEMVNQRGRDFIALRVMTLITSRFLRGDKPATLIEISCGLGVPSALASKLLAAMVKTGLLLEVANGEVGYAPARPVNHLTAHDVLRALHAGQGIELATKEDPWRRAVRAEFEKIVDAERQAGQSVTLEMLAENRGEVARATT